MIVPHFLWNLGWMRIVYVLTSLGMGGAERLVLDLASRMEKHRHAVSILVLRPPVSAH
jgi:hypothetical protein